MLDFDLAFRSPMIVRHELRRELLLPLAPHGAIKRASGYTRTLGILLAISFTFCGCELPQPEKAEPTSVFGQPRVVQPRHEAGVILLEDNLRFTERDGLAGGPRIHKDAVEGLVRVLRKYDIEATVLSLKEGETSLEQLSDYRALYLIDTLAVYSDLQHQLESYVKSGGVLVGIGEVARYDGEWRKKWPFGRIFGLAPRITDEWGTSVSREGTGLYRTAERYNDDPLVKGFDTQIDLGTNSTLIWVTAPHQQAKVVATFPHYMTHLKEEEPPQLVSKRIPALTVHQLERGVAVFLAALPSGRVAGGWQDSQQAGRLLSNALTYGIDELVLPPIEPRVTVGRNQVSYEPDWPKHVILRIESPQAADCASGTYTLKDSQNQLVKKGAFRSWRKERFWKSYLVDLDFSDVTQPGLYHLEINLPAIGQRMMTKFRVDEQMVKDHLVPSQIEFLRSMRCGERCHLNDPIVGGYHDATGDWAVRMWSMPHLVWCLARYLEQHPGHAGIKEELVWAVDWCLQMQGDDGSVYASIRPPDDHSGGHSPIDIRPWQDKMQRELEKRYSYQYTATYCAAMARAAQVLNKQDTAYAKRILNAAQRAFERITMDDAKSTGDLGNRIWAAAEMYRATANQEFISQARYDIPKLLERQLAKGQVVEESIYGDFFADPEKSTFNVQQWKVFHHIGIYLGLIEMSAALPQESDLRLGIDKALENFKQGYLLGMSSLTPYGQMACGLERTKDRKFKVYHFSHLDCWVHNHGLNCDMLAMATVALEMAQYDDDPALRNMAQRQINWLLGSNPLGYSMVTGLGQKQAPLVTDKPGTGQIKGGIPNGITGLGARNNPVWGTSWDSREYWLPQNAYLLSTLALLEEEPTSGGR